LAVYDGLDGRTFGNVLNLARKLTTIPSTLDTDLDQARKYRNYLAHEFFVVRSEGLLTDGGRAAMIDELRTILDFLRRVDAEFDDVWMAAWQSLGVNWDRLMEHVEQLRKAARTRATTPS
jgi:hypothetical protein